MIYNAFQMCSCYRSHRPFIIIITMPSHFIYIIYVYKYTQTGNNKESRSTTEWVFFFAFYYLPSSSLYYPFFSSFRSSVIKCVGKKIFITHIFCVRTTYTIYFADEMKNHKNERESTGRYIIWRWLQWTDRVGSPLF